METPYGIHDDSLTNDQGVCVLPMSKSTDLHNGTEEMASMYDKETIDSTVHDGDHSYVSENMYGVLINCRSRYTGTEGPGRKGPAQFGD